MKRIIKGVLIFVVVLLIGGVTKQIGANLSNNFISPKITKTFEGNRAKSQLKELLASKQKVISEMRQDFYDFDINWKKPTNQPILDEYLECYWKNMIEFWEEAVENKSLPRKGDGKKLGQESKAKCKYILEKSESNRSNKMQKEGNLKHPSEIADNILPINSKSINIDHSTPFYDDIILLLNNLPNASLDENTINWHTSNKASMHSTKIEDVILLEDSNKEYKMILSSTKFGDGDSININDNLSLNLYGSDTYFTIMIFQWKQKKYTLTDFKMIQKNYPYEPQLKDSEVYKGNDEYVLVKSFKYMYGMMSKKLDVFKIEDDTLFYALDDYWIGLAEEESDTIGYSSEIQFISKGSSDQLVIEKSYRNSQPNTKEAVDLNKIINQGSSRNLQTIQKYYKALKNIDFLSLETMYCNVLDQFHSFKNASVEVVLKEHKNYLSKYEISSYNILPSTIKQDSEKIFFSMEYSIIRKSDKVKLNYLLDLIFVFENNKICSVQETILKRY